MQVNLSYQNYPVFKSNTWTKEQVEEKKDVEDQFVLVVVDELRMTLSNSLPICGCLKLEKISTQIKNMKIIWKETNENELT